MPRLCLLGLVAMLSACSSEPSPDAVPDSSECIAITPTSTMRLGGRSTFWREHVGAGLREDLPNDGYDKLTFRFHEDRGALVTSERIPLGQGAEAAFSKSVHEVAVTQGVVGDNVQHLMFATSGELQLEVAEPADGIYRGILSDVVFVELEPTGLHAWGAPKPREEAVKCLHLAEMRFDTTPDPTRTCERAEDCANAKQEVCDLDTLRCTAADCTLGEPACAGEEVCMVQSQRYETGLCVPSCDPRTGGGCDSGRECVSTRYDMSDGICKPPGSTDVGESCEYGPTSTGCESGAVCQSFAPYWGDAECHTRCDFFGTEPGCPSDFTCQLKIYDSTQYCLQDRCYLGGTCREGDGDSPGGIDQPCSESAAEGFACGSDGQARRGTCVEEGESLMCRRLCRIGGNDCSAGSCTASPWDGIGICL